VFIVLGAAGLAAGVAVFAFWLVKRSRHGLPLVGTILLSAGALALVTGWVLAGGVNRSEALKTGGLAAASVVALYALWLNDRRRQVEEQRQEIERRRQELETERYALEQRRQELEHRRTDHDRERVADERFARSIELLGNEGDQVRVGALHALADLAKARASYTQIVLDVMCAYLRRPFDHPDFADLRAERVTGLDRGAAERERQVRRTAQVLIGDLLPTASTVSTEDAPVYDLDLHGATLEYFDLSHRVIGQLRARLMNLYGTNTFRGMRILGPAWFTESCCWGRFRIPDTVFEDRSWFSKFQAHEDFNAAGCTFNGDTKLANGIFRGEVSFAGARFHGSLDLSNCRFENSVDFRVDGGAVARTHGMRVSLDHDHQLPAGWTVDTSRGTSFGLVRA
jgi:hypothetical protein